MAKVNSPLRWVAPAELDDLERAPALLAVVHVTQHDHVVGDELLHVGHGRRVGVPDALGGQHGGEPELTQRPDHPGQFGAHPAGIREAGQDRTDGVQRDPRRPHR